MKLPKFIFSNKWYFRIIRHLLFWIARIMFLSFAIICRNGYDNFVQNVHVLDIIKFSATIILICEIGFCYIVTYVLAPQFLLKRKYGWFFLFFLVDILLFKMLGDEYNYWNFNMASWSVHDRNIYYWNTFIEFLNDGPVAATAIFLCLKLFKTWYAKQAEGQMLAKANAEAEMQILKAQVQPHFLFNTLNNIYSFTLNESPKAEELVSNLYEIMRYMVEDCSVEQIELIKDLKMIQDYIELEKVRYGNRLNFEINIEGEYQNKMITPLLLIPFVENSFKHGTSKMLKEPWIKLFIQADDDVLHFTLTNSKPSEKIMYEKGGIGLNNVKKRLELLYPQNHLLLIESTEHTFTVNMQIPLYKVDNKVVA